MRGKNNTTEHHVFLKNSHYLLKYLLFSFVIVIYEWFYLLFKKKIIDNLYSFIKLIIILTEWNLIIQSNVLFVEVEKFTK